MAEQGLILDIDTQFIERLKKADQSLGSMIHNADKLTESLKKAFNSVNGSNIDLISRMATQWEALGNQKLRLDVDTSKVEKLTSLLDDTVKTMQAFSSNGVELFDTDKVYDNTKSIFELNKELSAVEKKITELKAAWDGDIFEPPINEKTKKPWSRGSKAYKAAREAWESDKEGRVDKEEVAAELALLAEKKAILQEELRWANMTQDERAEYVKKKLKEELNAEQKHNNSIIAEYRKTVNEMLGIMRETDRLSKKDDSGVINPEIQQLNVRFAQLNQERIAMEQNYGNIIVKVAEEANAKAVKIYAERKLTEERLRKDAEQKEWEAYLSTPEGALQLASDSKTLNEMEEAQEYLKIARGDVDSTKDRELIDELNNAYTRLRIAIEDLTTAEKNEHALQPSVRNEYVRLLRELEKIQDARNRLSETESFMNADSQAYDNYNNLLRRERDIQDKLNSIRTNSIVESEGKRINLLEETDRAYLAERAQRDLSETERVEREKLDKIRARYKEVLDELRRVQHEKERMEDAEMKYGGDYDSTNANFELAKRQEELNNERILIETQHQEKISDIQEGERRKRLKDEVDAAERAARQTIEARKKANKRDEDYRSTYRGAMEYSRETNSIQEQIQAIKYLKQARESLNRSDFSSEKKYREALNNLTLEIDRQTDSIKELNLESEKTPVISGQLKTAITNMVGIGAIKGYVTQLIRIRGEFELQHKSLQVLLRNKDEANRLWEQTVDLAVKSPYRVDQLVTATKQLAAYRVETEKLHSTTRMLADLSSGLGVEINRLILAFGQVKAANFLRGTELRQFSEAGINILDELAEHYSILEGRVVSVGDVFDRVSKRMVSFADVETVLQKMTSEGGQFYKMQEQQAETLRGMTMNLKDSIMLMYNDIGEATDGVLKGTMTFFKHLVDNWKSYANIITTVVGALAGYKAAMIAGRLATSLWNSVANIAAVATVRFGSSATWAASRVRLLNKAMSVNPFLRVLSIITAVTGAIFGFGMSFDKAGEGAKSHLQILDENAIAAKNTAAGIKELTDERNELLKVENRSEEQEKRLNDVTSARTRLLGELITVNEEYAKSLRLAGDDSEKMSEVIEEQNAKLKSQLALAYNLKDVDWEETSNAQTKQGIKIGAEAKYSVVDKSKLQRNSTGPGTWQDWDQVLDEVQDLIKSGAELSEVVEGIKASTKKAGFNYERKKDKIISMLRELFDEEGIGDIIADYIEADTIVDETFDELGQTIAESVSDFSKSDYGKMLVEGLGSEIDEVKNDALKELQDYWKYVFTNDNIPESAQKLFIDQIAKIFNLEEGWFTKQISKELSAWQKGYNTILEDLTKNKGLVGLSPVTATTSIKDALKDVNNFIETNEAIVAQFEQQKQFPGILKQYTKEQAEQAKNFVEYGKFLKKMLGGNDGGGGTDTRYTNLIKTVNDVYSAFDKLEEKFGDTIATEMLWRDYSESIDTAFKSVGKSANWVREQFGDLTSKESLKSALDWIAENASTKEARLQAKTASAKISVDIEIENRDKAFDKLTKQVEDMFAGYELSIELDKLQVPKEFAKEFFNIDSIDISELRNKVVKMKSKFDDKGTEGTKAYEEFLRKLDEMETKSQQERLKKYLQYTRNAIGERGKILMEETLQLGEIAKTFQLTDTFAVGKGLVSKEQLDTIRELGYTVSSLMEQSDEDILASNLGINAEQLSSLREYVKLLKEREAIAIEGVKRETRQKLDKFDFEQFKGSEVFQELYSDLSNAPTAALDSLIKKLEAHKDQWNELPIDQVKEYVKLLKDAKEALESNKMPRELIEEQLDVINNSDYGNVGDASKAMVDAEARIEQLEREKSIVENIANKRAQGINDLDIMKTLQGTQILLMSRTADSIYSEIDGQKTLIADAQAFLNAITLITNAYKKQIENINKVKTVVDKVFGGWRSINSLFKDGSMSAELLEMFQTLSDAGFEMREMVSETRSAITNLKAAEEGATKFGYALDTASGIIGIIVAAVKVVVGLFNYFSEKENNQINADIDENMRAVEKLQHAYEDLERQIDDAFTTYSVSRLTRELNKNLEKQKQEIEDNIALEEDKKDDDKDQGKIDEWNRQLDDIERQQAENIKKMFSTLTDGILDNVLDATRGFVDAWYDAYDETGDGMKGLENNFKEMFTNMLKQQASLTLISPFIDNFKKQLKGYMNDSRLTVDEATALRSKWEEIAPQMNDALEQYFGSFSDILYGDYGELSDLEKGIQGMTEDQAEVLAAYWNSCRFILSNIDSTLTNLASSVLGGGGATNPIVDAITTQTKVVEQIRDLIGSIIASGGSSTHQLSYLRVNDA